MPAEPWCIRIRACGSARRLPGVPAESRNWPALHASPSASVATSFGISRITSRIASIDGHRAAGRVDPQGDVGCLVLGGEREQLRRDQRAVVVVERAVEHEHALVEQLAPRLGAELGDLSVVCHAPSVRAAPRAAASRSAPGGSALSGPPLPPCARDHPLLAEVTCCTRPRGVTSRARGDLAKKRRRSDPAGGPCQHVVDRLRERGHRVLGMHRARSRDRLGGEPSAQLHVRQKLDDGGRERVEVGIRHENAAAVREQVARPVPHVVGDDRAAVHEGLGDREALALERRGRQEHGCRVELVTGIVGEPAQHDVRVESEFIDQPLQGTVLGAVSVDVQRRLGHRLHDGRERPDRVVDALAAVRAG